MITTEVAILGGGLAGLTAARALHRAAIPFQLFEARDRLGGRILSVDAAGGGGFDLGPSWFWPQTQPGMTAVLADLGLAAFAQHGSGDMLFERSLRGGPDRVTGLGHDTGSWRAAGGMGALVQALARDLPEDRLHLNAVVRAMRLDAGGVTLTIAARDPVTARHVIAALPPRLMAERVALTPAPDAATLQRWRAVPTWMAPHAKFVAIYDRAFWRDAGLSGMAQSLVGPLAEIHDATTAAGDAALFGFVGLPAAARASLTPDGVIRAATDQLARLFGPAAASPRATLFKDWACDPFTATPADHVPSGHPSPPGAPLVTGVWAARLLMAGSEVSRTDPGYLAGAVTAAQDAAHAIIAAR